ncbi:MAG: branched-chain amino acid ABC transporter permease, partial [Desulfuromonas sp.]
MIQNIKHSLLISLWFVFLTFPLMVIRVNTLKDIVEWRWMNMVWVAVGTFILSMLWRWALHQKQRRAKRKELEDETESSSLTARWLADTKMVRGGIAALLAIVLVFPWVVDTYQANIMVLALIFVVLGLGLNITVGLAGLLDLGYVAFFLVGAYTYGVLYQFTGLGFWACLPI